MLSRLLNILRAELSYALSLAGIVRVRHLPTFVSVEPANYCCLHCPECPVGNGTQPSMARERLTMKQFERILNEVQRTAHTMQFYFQGEPLLNPDLVKMIHMAHQAGLYTIVSTNAQLITPLLAEQLTTCGLDEMIVSIDGFSEESYAAYRVGGSLHKALEGLELLSESKQSSRPRITLQVLRLKTNEHEWDWIREHYRSLGADRLSMKTAQLYHYEHGHPLMPTDERYSRYRLGKDGLYHLQRRHTHSCHRLWTGCVITTRGELLPCCYDKAAEYALGNIYEQSLSTIWHSDKANAFRRQVITNQHDIPICNNCIQ